MKKFERVFNHRGYPDRNIQVGDLVSDDLTGRISKVIKVTPETGMDAWQGNIIYINSKFLDGHRHCWQVTKIRRKNHETKKN